MIAALLATLHIMTHNGAIYDVVENIPAGSCIIGGTETLVYEASTFNTCQEIRLNPGCYRVEMMGGLGGKNEECKDWAEQMITNPLSGMFTLDTETTVYAFRGGDGMPGTVNKSGSYYGSFGGGASGADSIVVVGDRVFRARGGAGQMCAAAYIKNGLVGLNNPSWGSSRAYANGSPGGWTDGYIGHMKKVCLSMPTWRKDIVYTCGGGGGGAPSAPGANTVYGDGCMGGVANDGADGTAVGGGNGGDVTDALYRNDGGDTNPKSASGGRGGANVTWQCGGQTIVSYGGGGGGACVNGVAVQTADGGDGGSGSTGTSNTSYLRIYKM